MLAAISDGDLTLAPTADQLADRAKVYGPRGFRSQPRTRVRHPASTNNDATQLEAPAPQAAVAARGTRIHVDAPRGLTPTRRGRDPTAHYHAGNSAVPESQPLTLLRENRPASATAQRPASTVPGVVLCAKHLGLLLTRILVLLRGLLGSLNAASRSRQLCIMHDGMMMRSCVSVSIVSASSSRQWHCGWRGTHKWADDHSSCQSATPWSERCARPWPGAERPS